MSAADVLTRLASADVRLAAEGERLSLDAPADAPLSARLLARVRSERPALWQVASGAWQGELSGWPANLKSEWAERAALREFEGQQPRELAERAAFLELREAAEAGNGQWAIGNSQTGRPDALPLFCPIAHCPLPIAPSKGCASLTEGGRGPCARCGYRRPTGAGGG